MATHPETFQAEIKISSDMAQRYATISGDTNPIHLDEAFARKHGLKGPIIHGLCTAALVAARACAKVGSPEELREIHFRFKEPVYPGETLKLSGRLKEKTATNSGFAYALSCQDAQKKDVLTHVGIEFGKLSDVRADKTPKTLPEMKVGKDRVIIEKARVKDFCELVGENFSEKKAPPFYCGVYAIKALLHCGEANGFVDSKAPGQVLHVSQAFEFYEAPLIGETVATEVRVEQRRIHRDREILYFHSESSGENTRKISKGRWLIVIFR